MAAMVPGHDFVDGRDVAAHAVDQVNRPVAADRELYVVDHLPVAHFDCDELLCLRLPADRVDRERPERDRTQQPGFDPLRTQLVDRRAAEPPRDAVADQDDFGVLGSVLLAALFGAADRGIFRLQFPVHGFKVVMLEEDRADHVRARLRDVERPLRNRRPGGQRFRQRDRLHGLTDHAVCQQIDDDAVFFGQLEGEAREVAHLLRRGRREHDAAVTAVSAAFDDLIVVGLLRPDVAEPGAAAHDVHHERGQFAAGEIADPLLLQADSEPRTRGHRAAAVRGGAHDHVDRGDLTLRLQERAPELRETARRGVGDFAGRRDRVAEEAFASGEQRAVDHGFVALQQHSIRVVHHASALSI